MPRTLRLLLGCSEGAGSRVNGGERDGGKALTTSTVAHTALDGSDVLISAENPGSVFTCYAIYLIDGETQEIGSGGLTYGREVASDVGIVAFTAEYSLQGGRLLVGAGYQQDPSTQIITKVQIAVWEGRFWSLKATRFGDVDPDEVRNAYSSFDIEERDTGVVLHPGVGVETLRDSARRPDLVTRADGCRRLHTWALTNETAEALPGWEGATVPGGELFADGSFEEPTFTYILLGSSSVTRIYPPRESDEEAAEAGVRTIRVDWTS